MENIIWDFFFFSCFGVVPLDIYTRQDEMEKKNAASTLRLTFQSPKTKQDQKIGPSSALGEVEVAGHETENTTIITVMKAAASLTHQLGGG